MSFMAKELVPIILYIVVLRSVLAKQETLFQHNNLSSVDAICKGSSKDKVVIHQLRCLYFSLPIFTLN